MQRCFNHRRCREIVLVLLAGVTILFGIAVCAAAADNAGEQILHVLGRTVDWYRRVASLVQTPTTAEEVVCRDNVRQDAIQVLQRAFASAKGQAALMESTPATAPASGPTTVPATAPAPQSRLAQAAATAAQRVAQIQAHLRQIEADLADAPPDGRPVLEAKREKAAADLRLAQARQEVIGHMMSFASETGGAAGLAQQIDDLERSVPEALAAPRPPTTAPSAAPDLAAAEPTFRPESAGIFGLIGQMLALSRKMSELKDLAEQTKGLHDEDEKLRLPLRTQLLTALSRGDALSKAVESDDPQILAAQRQEIDALAERFKKLTAALVPLSEEETLLETTHGTLLQWRGTLSAEYRNVLRHLLFRLGGIALAVFIVLAISRVWRHVTFRYVSDIRRRRQFLLVRRIVVSLVLLLVIVAGFVTEFSSLATFAGLITAGIAVALQTVILSGVAHFFFMGRYGVRVGDRVTIADVTGDVIDIGIFRLYLMELSGSNADLHPTGRIVVFSNSVLFQPTAFYKQLPGAEYGWHEVALTLAPDSDLKLAETRLLGAVESVYGEYKDNVEKQYETLKQHVHVRLSPPKPEGRLRLVDEGLEFVVRYPVEIRRASEIDDRITRALLDTIRNEPKLKLVPSGTPTIQPAELR